MTTKKPLPPLNEAAIAPGAKCGHHGNFLNGKHCPYCFPASVYLYPDPEEAKRNKGYNDAWFEGSPLEPEDPNYMAGWRQACADAELRDFAEEDRLMNKYAP